MDEHKHREDIMARERGENDIAIATARRLGKNVTFVADDGCEVTVTPSGAVFYNASASRAPKAAASKYENPQPGQVQGEP